MGVGREYCSDVRCPTDALPASLPEVRAEIHASAWGEEHFWDLSTCGLKVKQLINSSALLLQERDLELELGDDYILDLQSKGCSVLGVPECPLCTRALEPCGRASVRTSV